MPSSVKILAYFMHEPEDELIRQNLTSARRTDSFYIGDANPKALDQLRNSGIIYQVLEQAPEPAVSAKGPGVSRHPSRGTEPHVFNIMEKTHAPSPIEIADEQTEAGFPAFYKFSVVGPLLDDDKQELSDAGISIYEYVPPDSYVVRITDQTEYDTLNFAAFTQRVAYYSSADTGVYTNLKPPTAIPAEKKEKTIKTFDVLLYRAEDMTTFLSWLSDNHIQVAGSSGLKVRIFLIEDSSLINKIAANSVVRYLYEYIEPKLHNELAVKIIGVDVYSGNTAAAGTMSYMGEGEIIGIADTGIDLTHPDLSGQIHGTAAWGRAGNVTDPAGHGTHVAGSVAGDGTASGGSIKGMAPEAKLFFQSLLNANEKLELPLQLQDLFEEAYKQGARIHNNSWGASTSSNYTVNSMEVDDFVYQNKDMLLVFSAGNDGNNLRFNNVPQGYVDFLSIGSPASAKNVLTVGASRSSRTTAGYAAMTYAKSWPKSFPYPPYYDTQKVSGDVTCLAGFSSRGPCDDDRVKPDVVAPGTDIASTKSSLASLSSFWGDYPGNPAYAIMGGTSMSAPIVTGFAALVREYFRKEQNHLPSAALLKATIINGCEKLTGPDAVLKFADLPNFNQGFGRINANKTVPTPTNPFFFYFVDNYKDTNQQFAKTGQRLRLKFTISKPGSWLRICLAYTDVPARALQNNLNLMLDTKTKKWLGNENAASLVKAPDSKNNVEVIAIDNADTGTYTLQIVASNLVKGPQDFSLVITCSDTSPVVANA